MCRHLVAIPENADRSMSEKDTTMTDQPSQEPTNSAPTQPAPPSGQTPVGSHSPMSATQSPPPPPRSSKVDVHLAPPVVPAADAILVVNNLSKWFGDLVAVSDISFSISAGVTALLGPNGAGKSTTLRMISGQAKPSSGTVQILGKNPATDPSITAEIGIAPQQEQVFGYLTALEFVTTSALLQGVDSPAEAARQALSLVELDADDKRKLPTYSKGMRQRVKLAQAIVHDPKVILLDEPLSGLDPRQRVNMVRLFHRLAERGKAVIVSSHVLEEVERFGSNIVVIAKGRLAAQGDFRAIRAMMDNHPQRVRIVSDKPKVLATGLITHGNVQSVELDHESLEVSTRDIAGLSKLLPLVAHHGDVRLIEVIPLDEDLESVFKYLVG